MSSRANTPAVDFVCPRCGQSFQLKSLKTWNRTKIVDAGYDSMVRAIRSDRVPNLLIMQYSPDWMVRNLILVHGAFFAETAIEKRPALSDKARRAGWVGCNILLDRIPEDGKIAVVSDGVAAPERQVRHAFSRAGKIAAVPPPVRGWTLDVLIAIRKLERRSFSLQELYQQQPYLERIHANNRHIRAKIRQQLQVLRDLGLITFAGAGNYVLRV